MFGDTLNKAIIVGLDLGDEHILYHMDELSSLAEANDLEVVFSITQKLPKKISSTLIGKGKLDEIKMAINTYDASLVIFNDELTASQLRNLETFLEVSVIDRSMLILNIFASRAKTSEAMIEVELAQLNYMLPRLSGLTSSLSRQGGGFRAKGPGEKQLELDKRIIEVRINKLKNDLKKIMLVRKTKRKKRTLPIVALVGYTNAGKSSLMNHLLTKYVSNPKTVLEKDQLFATLTTHARHIKLNDNHEFILIDTVGFVSKLPHHLVNSFKSTLEEILEADLIIHVVDASNPFYEEQIKTTNNVLQEIGIKNIPVFFAFNKADLLPEQYFPPYENALLISTKTAFNINLLINHIKEIIFHDNTQMELLIPYEQGNIINTLNSEEQVRKQDYLNDGIYVVASINNKHKHKYMMFMKK